MIRPDSKVGESAEAKKIDNQQLNSQLSVFSQNCQDAENKCWELMSKWIGGKSETIAVEYHNDFDIEAEIEKIDDELRSAGTMGNLGSSFLTGTGK